MKVAAAQMSAHLNSGLKPIYLISGDEPLQMMETVDAVRAKARELGFTQREVFTVERGFSWGNLLESSNMMSLFAEQRILELRMPTGAPGKEGGEALRAYCERPADDAVLIIQSGKIDKRSQNSAWYKAIAAAGVVTEVWPVKATEIMGWIRQRLQMKGLNADQDAIKMIAQRVEGNMLAAAQEIEKLALLVGQGNINAAQVQESVANSSRFSVYDLIDSALMGPKAAVRCVRILNGLKSEGVQPVQVLAPLVGELRNLADMTDQVANGARIQQVIAHVWSSKKNLMSGALGRLTADECQSMLQQAAQIDRINKGMDRSRDPWVELQRLSLQLAGAPL